MRENAFYLGPVCICLNSTPPAIEIWCMVNFIVAAVRMRGVFNIKSTLNDVWLRNAGKVFCVSGVDYVTVAALWPPVQGYDRTGQLPAMTVVKKNQKKLFFLKDTTV